MGKDVRKRTSGCIYKEVNPIRLSAPPLCCAPQLLRSAAADRRGRSGCISSHGEREGSMTPQRGPRSTSPHGAAHRSKPRISPFRWRIASRYLRGGAHLSVARGRVRHPRLLPCSPTAPGTCCGILDPQAIRARMRARRISAAGSLPPSGKIASARNGVGFGPRRFHLTWQYAALSFACRAFVFAMVCECSPCPTI